MDVWSPAAFCFQYAMLLVLRTKLSPIWHRFALSDLYRTFCILLCLTHILFSRYWLAVLEDNTPLVFKSTKSGHLSNHPTDLNLCLFLINAFFSKSSSSDYNKKTCIVLLSNAKWNIANGNRK